MGGEERLGASPEMHGGDWPLRPWLLAGMLGLAGLLIHFASDGHDTDAGRMALVAFLFFGPLAAAFSLEQARWKEVAVFSAIVGLAMAGITWRAVHAEDHYPGMQYAFAAGVIATLLAVPLFQAGFHKTRFATPYRQTHFFVWTDVVAGGGALAFTGLTFAMTAVLAALFHLLKIDFLKDLLEDGWFDWTLAGAAFGAALGVLRNQLKIIGTLQSVVLLVLSLLAVPLALALVIFLGAMVTSGPKVLWEATRSATPILLTCAAGSFVLVNAVVRDEDEASSKSLVMRIAALVLALGILPLTVFAAISIGTRVSAYGLSPERLWGLIAIAVACLYGLAYLIAVLRGWKQRWRGQVRSANFYLAVGTCVVALILALPILDFGAVSAASQISRLRSGAVSVEDFDYDALKWDFGDAGKRALAKLAEDPNAAIAKLAREAQARLTKPYRWPGLEKDKPMDRLDNLHTEITDPALREKLESFVRSQPYRCKSPCVAVDLGTDRNGSPHIAFVENRNVEHLRQDANGNLFVSDGSLPLPPERSTPVPGAVPQVEVRKYEGRRIYVNGKPVGRPFD
jgi:hypothetical protein